jgi:SAM-dependent methyltransferase
MRALLERLIAIAERFPRDYCPNHRALLARLHEAKTDGDQNREFQRQWSEFAKDILATPQWLDLMFPPHIVTTELLVRAKQLAGGKYLPTWHKHQNDLTAWIEKNLDPLNTSSALWALIDDLSNGDPHASGHFQFLSRYYIFKDILTGYLVDERLKPVQKAIFSQYALQRHNWKNSYAADYPYQGLSRLGIAGCKPAEERLSRYALDEYLRDTDYILDIGSNNGFLSLLLGEHCGRVTGIEYNPYLVSVAEIAQRSLAVGNVDFLVGDFVEFDANQKFDAVLSLANHCTIDGNLSMGFEGYIAKVFSLLKPGGYLFFESHNVFGPGSGAPGDDGDLDAKFDIAERYFEVLKYKMTPAFVPFGDIDKLFVILRRRDSYLAGAKRTFSLDRAKTAYVYVGCSSLPNERQEVDTGVAECASLPASAASADAKSIAPQPDTLDTPSLGMTEKEEMALLATEQQRLEDALALIETGRNAEAIESLTRLTNAGSVRPDVYRTLGLLHEAGGDAQLAIKHLQIAASLELAGTEALRDLVRLYIDQCEYGKAIGCLALIVQQDGPSEALVDVITQLLSSVPANAIDLAWLSPEVQLARDELARVTAEYRQLATKPAPEQRTPPIGQAPRILATDRRIAFLIHAEELLNHFRSVCQLLRPGSFVFLIHANGHESAQIAEAIGREGWHSMTTADVLRDGRRFRALVSNHPVSFDEPPLIKRLADINIRFMYAAGKSGWNLREWNQLYDVILCYGPYHAERFLASTNAVVFEMGYPRFDSFFDGSFDRPRLAESLRCDPRRQTVVWLPTWHDLSTVGLYDEAIARLGSRFNILVKVHPLMAASEPGKVDALERLGFNCVIRNAMDNVALYSLADYVLCDYGGPAFGAIYTDRNLLLLNIADAPSNELLGDDSTEMLIRRSIVNVDRTRVDQIDHLLADEQIWAAQRAERARLRRMFFAPYFGYSSRMAATILEHIERIPGREGIKNSW